MFDFLEITSIMSKPILIGLAIGILAAWGIWVLFPESVDRASIGAWFIGGGFVAGLLWTAVAALEKKQK